jgi:NodT family efflux transporter outer membrane factor (OMF) lipoprotein
MVIITGNFHASSEPIGIPLLLNKGLFILWIILALLIFGCTVGPEYRPPKLNTPEKYYHSSERDEETDSSALLKEWWILFKDKKLDFLIQQAIASNKDLRISEARIREARARFQIVSGEKYPILNAGGDFRRTRTSEEIESPRGGETQSLFEAGFDSLWEIDLFGGTRRSVEAAHADISAVLETKRDILVTLLAEVARNYIELRGSQQRIAIALQNIHAQRQTVELIQGRVKAGIDNELRLSQAKAQLAALEAQTPILERKVNQALYRLDVLTGKPPGGLSIMLKSTESIPDPLFDFSVGIPSDLLRRRPDIRKAERELAAATARIGIATADLFPKFSLTGIFGRQGLDFSDLADSGSTFWSIGPSIRWPIFNSGRIKANIEVQNARQESSLIQYEKSVLIALEEVENALFAITHEQKSRISLAKSVLSNQKAVDISSELYRRGMTNFLDVLISQRSLYISQDTLVQNEQNIATSMVALFKALGGGWQFTEF